MTFISWKAERSPLSLFFCLLLLSFVSPISSFGIESEAGKKPSCTAWLQNHCDSLWSLENRGNYLGVKLGLDPNQFSWTTVNYMKVLAESEKKLPPAFSQILIRKQFFKKLRKWLERREKRIDSAEEQFLVNQELSPIRDLWDKAREEIVFQRTEVEMPGYYLKEDPSLAETNRSSQIVEKTRIELYEAIWKDRPEFEEMKKLFEEVRSAALKVIAELPSIEPETRKLWSDRVKTIQLGLPSDHYRLTGKRACAEDDSNALNSLVEHKIFVCGGLFGTEDMAFTLAHELAHAVTFLIDGGVSVKDFPLFKKILKKTVDRCHRKESLGERDPEWPKTREELMNLSLPEPPKHSKKEAQMLSCFQQRKPRKPDASKLDHAVENAITDIIDDLATRREFSRRVNPKARSVYGTETQNPEYLKGCDEYIETNPPDSIRSSAVILHLFLEEFLDQKNRKPGAESEVLKRSIAVLTKITAKIKKFLVLSGGMYSSDSIAYSLGIGEDIGENLADALGTQFLRSYLEKFPLTERRTKFLQTISYFCDKHYSEGEHSEVARIERDFSSESHALRFTRLKTVITPKMAELLQCERETSVKSCESSLYPQP
jgi:hypothetical protein